MSYTPLSDKIRRIHPALFDLRGIAATAGLSVLLVALSFAVQGTIGLWMSDEGNLWYGTWRTTAGDVPMRDWSSYDPGRYYWGAFWGLFLGDGIMVLRKSNALFQIIGLTFGLAAVRRITHDCRILVPIGLMLAIWMIPRHKLFESSLSMAAVFFAVWLIENPTRNRHFVAGLFVGTAAFFGRNHGLYGFLAFLSLILFLQLKGKSVVSLSKGLGWWAGGIALGYSPELLMMAAFPGFGEAWLDKSRFLVRGGTNIPLPIPWPWAIDYSRLDWVTSVGGFGLGVLFLVVPVFCISWVAVALTTDHETLQRRRLLIASGFVAVFYAHHAFARADASHLGQAVHPVLIGLVATPVAMQIQPTKIMKFIAAGLLLIGTALGGLYSDFWKMQGSPAGSFVRHQVGKDTLWIDTSTANFIDCITRLVREHTEPDELVLIAPLFPAMYPILGRKSPIWGAYLVRPSGRESELAMIGQLEAYNVRSVILGDFRIDKRDDMRFKNTHPLLWQSIMDRYKPVGTDCLPPNMPLLKIDGARMHENR